MPSKRQSIILGGLVAGLLSTSYLGLINILCCAGVIIGALVAVWHYTDSNELTISAGQGAVLGLLTALVGSVISLVLNYIVISFGVRSDQAMLEFFINRFGDSMPPESYDQLIEQLETPITLATYLKSALWGILGSAVFGTIGGAIGAVIFKKGSDEPDSFPE